MNWRVLIILPMMWIAQDALAHLNSNAFYSLDLDDEGRADVTLELDLRDVHAVLPLDRDQDGAVTWGEVKAQESALKALAASRFSFADSCDPIQISTMRVHDRLGAKYLHFDAHTSCSAQPVIQYAGFLNIDRDHAGLFRIATPEGEQNVVLSARHQEFRFAETQTAWWFFIEGIWHILIGFDHILFLMLLLLPTMLQKKDAPRLTFALASKSILWVVTAFTIGHSITLGLAASGTFLLPAHIVEPAIALTIVLAAINNIAPFMHWPEALIAGFFGTIHGFGFASVLGELGVSTQSFWVDLLSFNVGVELGQMLIVTVCLPLLWHLRQFASYRRFGVPAASLAASLLALFWFIDRLP